MRKSLILGFLDGRGAIFLAVLLLIAVAVPVLNLATAETSPFHIPSHWVPLFGKYTCYALLAVAVDFIWGYFGIRSLGNCPFFALCSYAIV